MYVCLLRVIRLEWDKSLEVESLIQNIQNKWKISNTRSNSDSDHEKEDDLEELFGQDLKKLYADNTLDFLHFGLDKVAAALLGAHVLLLSLLL